MFSAGKYRSTKKGFGFEPLRSKGGGGQTLVIRALKKDTFVCVSSLRIWYNSILSVCVTKTSVIKAQKPRYSLYRNYLVCFLGILRDIYSWIIELFFFLRQRKIKQRTWMISINKGRKKCWYPTEMARAGPSRENVHKLSGVYINYWAYQNSARFLLARSSMFFDWIFI